MRGRHAETLILGLGPGVGVAVLIVVHVALRGTYWDYSEGVYALTARLMAYGHDLYSEVVGAQPPGVFLVGAAVLWLHDGLEWLRFAVASLQLLAGLAAGCVVWRLTGSRIAAISSPAALLLTPWAVREHGALLPDVVALPLLVCAPLISAPVLLGVVCGVLPLVKVTFLIPAVTLVVLSQQRRRTAGIAAGTLVAGLALVTALSGVDFPREAFYAQTQSGHRALGALAGYWAQAGWNLLGLAVPAAIALHYRGRARDRRLLRVTAGLGGSLIVTLLTNLKLGTSLDILVPVEASLVPLAVCGAVWALRAAHVTKQDVRGSASDPRWAAGAFAVSGLALLLVLAQSASLLIAPRDPQPFVRPLSRSAWSITMTAPELRGAVARARACSPKLPLTTAPLIAFLAHRSLLGDQPDQFIVPRSATLHGVEARVQAAARHGACPG